MIEATFSEIISFKFITGTDFLDNIGNALNSAKWKSELSFLISPLPDSKEVLKVINGAFHSI